MAKVITTATAKALPILADVVQGWRYEQTTDVDATNELANSYSESLRAADEDTGRRGFGGPSSEWSHHR